MNPYKRGDAPRSQEDVDLARSAAQSVRLPLVDQDGGRALVDGLLAALSMTCRRAVPRGRARFTLGLPLEAAPLLPVFAGGVCRGRGASLEVITANFASTEIAGDLLNAVSVDPPRRDAQPDDAVCRVFQACFQTNKRGRRRSHR